MRFRGEVEANPRIKSLADAVKWQPAELEALSIWLDTAFTRNERQQFATEGASGGAKWPPLSPAYAKWKRRRYPGRKIMTLTGRLRKSLTSKGHPLHVRRHYAVPRPTVLLGTRDVKAAYHIAGNPLKNPRLPERDTLQTTPQQWAQYRRLVREYMTDIKLKRVARILDRWPRRR